MKILVISDTHESRYWKEFLKRFAFDQYDMVIHAGDNYSDIYDLKKYYNGEIVAVPGLWREEYQDKSIENIRLLDFGNFNIIISHVEKEGRVLHTDDKPFIQIFGHTHICEIEENNDGILFNSGHLKNRIDRGSEASYGEIVIEKNSINLCVKKAINDRIVLKKNVNV